jgi:hypothetical protein
VAPFFELWALVGEPDSKPETWQQQPLTPALLQGTGATGFTLRLDARNRKAARRARDETLEFGTFPALVISSDNHAPVPIDANSPPGMRPMIPKGTQGIPLGSVQILRSREQPQSAEWTSKVRVDVFRFRFTPAKGEMYGPVGADKSRIRGFPAVKPENAFLDPGNAWVGVSDTPGVEPSDTFDGAETALGRSVGVVDDTCSANFQVELLLPNREPLSARAIVFVAPPDFAPDRRPFLSLADELNDRVREIPKGISSTDYDEWVKDLFERVYETVSLFNLDHWRGVRASTLTASETLREPIKGDTVGTDRRDERAMGRRDKLRDPDRPILAEPNNPLPLSKRAESRHSLLAEIDELKNFVMTYPGRVEALVRPPFTVKPNEGSDTSTMQMPPFMRNSNALPLTLAPWQYRLLNDWVKALRQTPKDAKALAKGPRPLSESAKSRQNEVLARANSIRHGKR